MTSTGRRAAASGRNGYLDRISTLPRQKQAEFLERLRLSSASDRWIVRHRRDSEAAMRMLCFSHAGGGAATFRSWSAALPTDIEVWAVQLPGRETRLEEPAYRRMTPMIAALAQAIGPRLDKPFVFFGHSMGALVAFELARELRRSSMPQPSRLFLAAFRAPQLPSPNVKIYHWPDDVLRAVLETDGTPPEVLRDDELMRVLMPTLRADLEVCDTYEHAPQAPLACPFSVFGGRNDVRVPAKDLDGWRMHTASECSMSMFPGSHFFPHTARQLLLEKLQDDLAADGMLRRGCHHV